ncbi:MAG: hypothetical protein WBN32_07720 [Woeseia sp.]
MDKFEQRLKHDAAAIDAEVAPELRARIDVNLEPVARRQPNSAPGVSAFWPAFAGVAGLAVLAFLLLPAEKEAADPETQFSATPVYLAQQPLPMPLRLQPVELTEPLEQELQLLRADLERVRQSIARELRSTL